MDDPCRKLPAGTGRAPDAQGSGEIVALVLAAGRSRRFGAANKLLTPFKGQPMLARVVALAQEAGLSPLLVTGHEVEAVGALLPGVAKVHNPDHASGMARSLQAGLAALPAGVSGVLVMLGDMPRVRVETLRALLAAAQAHPQVAAIVPACGGQWGNPVLIRRVLFPAIFQLEGDCGARPVLVAAGEAVKVLPVEDPGVLIDVDTPEALA